MGLSLPDCHNTLILGLSVSIFIMMCCSRPICYLHYAVVVFYKTACFQCCAGIEKS